jgi:hypothetical protein
LLLLPLLLMHRLCIQPANSPLLQIVCSDALKRALPYQSDRRSNSLCPSCKTSTPQPHCKSFRTLTDFMALEADTFSDIHCLRALPLASTTSLFSTYLTRSEASSGSHTLYKAHYFSRTSSNVHPAQPNILQRAVNKLSSTPSSLATPWPTASQTTSKLMNRGFYTSLSLTHTLTLTRKRNLATVHASPSRPKIPPNLSIFLLDTPPKVFTTPLSMEHLLQPPSQANNHPPSAWKCSRTQTSQKNNEYSSSTPSAVLNLLHVGSSTINTHESTAFPQGNKSTIIITRGLFFLHSASSPSSSLLRGGLATDRHW